MLQLNWSNHKLLSEEAILLPLLSHQLFIPTPAPHFALERKIFSFSSFLFLSPFLFFLSLPSSLSLSLSSSVPPFLSSSSPSPSSSFSSFLPLLLLSSLPSSSPALPFSLLPEWPWQGWGGSPCLCQRRSGSEAGGGMGILTRLPPRRRAACGAWLPAERAHSVPSLRPWHRGFLGPAQWRSNACSKNRIACESPFPPIRTSKLRFKASNGLNWITAFPLPL